MSNEKLDIINTLINNISEALSAKVAPLIRDIKEKRSGIPALSEKIQQKKRDIIEKQLEEERAAAQKESAKVTPVLPEKNEQEAVKEEVKPAEKAEEKPAPVKEEKKPEEKKPEAKPQEKQPVKDKSKTYINPEFLNSGDRRRPAGVGAQGERKFNNRESGTGNKQGGFDRRTSLGGRTQPIAPPPAPVNGGKGMADKKKKSGGFNQKDEQKKSLSKRDLIKKGYVYEDEDEDGEQDED